MSNISNRHNILPFTAGKSVALSGQRLSKVGYKSTAKNKAKYPSVCCSVPKLEVSADLWNIYAPAIENIVRNALETAQDGIVKSLYESSEGLRTSVSDEEISISACLAYIESVNTDGRLTAELVENWFDTQVSDNLTVVIAEKLGTEDIEDVKIIQSVKAYRGLFASLSSGATVLNQIQIDGLIRALEISSTDDEISNKLQMRLNNMSNKKSVELLAL